MSRLVQEERLLCLLASELQEQPIDRQERDALFSGMCLEDWDQVMTLAIQNRVCPILMGGLMRNREISIPAQMGNYLEQMSFQNSICFYQRMNLVGSLLDMMKQQGIEGCILKGVTLSALFPTPESRTFSDIDVYIPDAEQFQQVVDEFEIAGYARNADDMTDHHESFFYQQQDITCDVELHHRLNTTWGNKKLDSTLDAIYREILIREPMCMRSVMGMQIPALPATFEALYLLMHLFQHFMNKGFGIRLLLDWVVFWKKEGAEADAVQLAEWIRRLGLTYFADAVDGICVGWLGMTLPPFGYLSGRRQKELEEELLDDVFAGGDFGHQDKTRMVITAHRIGWRTYLLELHRQTVRHYPRAAKWKLLLPILWVWTAVVFQYNNIVRRKISLKEVIGSTNYRTSLAEKFHIFDES